MIAKIIILAIWAFGLVNLIVTYPGIWETIAYWTLGLLLISHIAETLFVFKRIKAAPEPFLPNLISSLAFGHLHNRRYM